MFNAAGSPSSHNLFSIIRPVFYALPILFCFAIIQPALAVTVHSYGPFDVSFFDNGETYNIAGTNYTGSKNWTATEMDDVGAMLRMWDNGLLNAAGPRQIKLDLMWNPMGTDVGGDTISYYSGDGTTAATVAEKIWRQGVNINNPNADAYMLFDSTKSWNVGTSDPFPDECDFRSAVAHEIGHLLGFSSSYDLGVNGIWWGNGLTEWDKNLRDSLTDGNQPNVGGSGTPNLFNVTANPVYFDGTNAKAANGGARVAVYAPSTFNISSSLKHLDESAFPNALMSPWIYYGQKVRQPTMLEWQIMKDLGWTLDTAAKTWNNSSGDWQWSTDNNWNSNGAPVAIQTASFTNLGLIASAEVVHDGDFPVSSLSFDTTTSFSIGGWGTLTIATGSLTRSAASTGTQTISIPVALGANALWNLAGSGQFIVSGAISGNYSLEKRGTGSLNLSGANTYTGLTRVQNGTMNVTGGSTNSAAFTSFLAQRSHLPAMG